MLYLIKKDLLYIIDNFIHEILICDNINKINNIKSKYIGKKSHFQKYIEILNIIDNNKKKKIGKIINLFKNNIINIICNKKKNIINKIKFNNNSINSPSIIPDIGSFHPITIIINKIVKFFSYHGYKIFNTNEIEDFIHNFDLLNIPKCHPSRSKQDTFWINNNLLLRTHTTSFQIRYSYINNIPPIKILSYGKVYRKDKDKTHFSIFHQLEILNISKNINILDLKKTITDLLNFIFNNNINFRIRNSFFPFTTPSFEVDIYSNNAWLEILGCGLIHSNVLKNMNINNKIFSGFAIGMGIERLLMIKYNITDIKDIFDNDIRFIDKFKNIN